MYKFIVVIFFSWISLSLATNHYVDNNANGNNNGTSWSNAWENFSDIEWNQIQPGDTLFISGGTDSTVYSNTLTIGFSGTAANLIVVRAGLDAGHNGRVIFDGDGTVDNGIYIQNHDYFRIEKLEFRKQTHAAIHFEGTGYSEAQKVNVVYIDSCTITELGGGTSGIYVGGWPSSSWDAMDSIFIRYNTVIAGQNEDGEPDCISAKHSSNIFIEGNTIIQDNMVSPNHCDAIQIFNIENAVIKNNYLHVSQDEWPLGQGQIVMAEKLKGDFYFYNNVVYFPDAVFGHNVFYNKDYDAGTYPNNWYMISNTWIGNDEHLLIANPSPNVTLKNNLFWSVGTPVDGNIYLDDQNDYTLIDGNLYGSVFNGTLKFASTALLTMTELNALNAETSGTPSARYQVDPLLQTLTGTPYGNDFNVGAGSPCIDAGVDLPPPYNTDINGVIRQPGHFTIGAYEYIDRGPDITPPEVTGATLLDSVTLKIMFSELLDETTAEDENNYSISNNIDIFNASLSGSEVILQTTTHPPGSYIVTVVNVEDLAGNPIAQSNTAEYSLITVVDPINNGLPNEYSLFQNYPNPFNPSTSIRFSLPKNQLVKLTVIDILGELISELSNREYDAGTYTIDFDGSALSSGFYFYRIETPEFIETKKMILLK